MTFFNPHLDLGIFLVLRVSPQCPPPSIHFWILRYNNISLQMANCCTALLASLMLILTCCTARGLVRLCAMIEETAASTLAWT